MKIKDPSEGRVAIEQSGVTKACQHVFGKGIEILKFWRMSSYGHECWRVNLSDSKSYLIKYPCLNQSLKVFKEQIKLQNLAGKSGVLVPPIIETYDDEKIIGAPFIVQEWVEGVESTKVIPDYSTEQKRDFGEKLGILMSNLHKVEGNEFTDVRGGFESTPNWIDLVGLRLQKYVSSNARAQILNKELLDRVHKKCLFMLGEVPADLIPRLTHCDLHLPNVVIGFDGNLYLLDFEHARFFDSASDFVKLDGLVFKKYPKLENSFMQAYEAADIQGVNWGLRLQLYKGIEYLAAIAYFGAKYPDKQMLDLHQQLLNDWLNVEI